jgi:integrase
VTVTNRQTHDAPRLFPLSSIRWSLRVDLDSEYLEYLLGQGLSEKTAYIYARYVAGAERWIKEQGCCTGLDACRPSELKAWASETIPFTHSSRGQAVAALNHWWAWKEQRGTPKAIRVPPQPQMVCRALEPDEARDLVKASLGWFPEGTATLFGLYLGLRRFEIAAAEWERFDPKRTWYTVTGKYDKTNTLPVHPILKSELPEGSGYVFKGRFGGHVTPATIWDWTKQVAGSVGLTEFTTHQLRHTALTTANDNLGDLRAVQTFARHEKPETTAGYTRTTRTRLQEVSEALDYL